MALSFYGWYENLEIDEKLNDEGHLHIAIEDQREYCQEWITKEDAIAIIKHLQEVFEINPAA